MIKNRGNGTYTDEIELLGFNAPDERDQLLADLIEDAIALNLTGKVVEASIKYAKPIRLNFLMQLSPHTSLANNLTLISRNISDFKSIWD